MLLYDFEIKFVLGNDLLSLHYCDKCGKAYKQYCSLWRHKNYECGKEPQFPCSIIDCNYRAKHKIHLKEHLIVLHKIDPKLIQPYLQFNR